MNWQDIATKISGAAPLLGTILGGPAGGVLGGAISLIAQSLGIKADAKPEEIMAAIQTDPEALVKLKTLELNHKIELQKLILESERMHLADVADARAREVKVTGATGGKDVNLYILSWVMVAGFFGLTYVLMKRPLPEGSSQAIFMLFGGLVSGFTAVIQYFFGSSKSSSDKTKLLKNSK